MVGFRLPPDLKFSALTLEGASDLHHLPVSKVETIA